MERIPSHSSLCSLGESEISVGGHDATEGHVASSSSVVVGEGRIEAGESLEHIAASFSDQHQQQASHNTREEARSDIAGSLDALGGGEVHAGHSGVAPGAHHEGASLEARLQQAETSTAMNRARLGGKLRGFDAEHQQRMIVRIAGEIIENHNLLIGLLRDSTELPAENVRELKAHL